MEKVQKYKKRKEWIMQEMLDKMEERRRYKNSNTLEALGYDKIPSEALQNLGREALDRITNLINNIYERGTWPEELLKTILIPLPKKNDVKKCKDYRTISLISHITKTISRVVLTIEKKTEENLGNDQF
ncbi:hypothetical protein J437_LFUL016486, partial [Ladona fulva]